MFRRLHSNHGARLRESHSRRNTRSRWWCTSAETEELPVGQRRHHAFILQGMRDNATAAKQWGLVLAVRRNPGQRRARPREAARVRLGVHRGGRLPSVHRPVAQPRNRGEVRRAGGPRGRQFHRAAVAAGCGGIRGGAPPAAHSQAVCGGMGEPRRLRTGVAARREGEDSTPHSNCGRRSRTLQSSLRRFQLIRACRQCPESKAALRPVARRSTRRLAQTPPLRRRAQSPNAPGHTAASGLSPYLHYGHLSIQEVAEAVLGEKWTPKRINAKARNKDDFFCRDANVNSFLDEAITWRCVGYHWNFRCEPRVNLRTRTLGEMSVAAAPSATDVPQINFEAMDFSPGGENTLDVVLPQWAKATLRKHERDRREHLYTLEEFEAAATHDELWNAAHANWSPPAASTTTCGCCGARRCWSGARRPRRRTACWSTSTTSTRLDGRDPNSLHGHSLVLRPVRPAVAAGAAGVRYGPLHVVGEHRAEVRSGWLLRVCERLVAPPGRRLNFFVGWTTGVLVSIILE